MTDADSTGDSSPAPPPDVVETAVGALRALLGHRSRDGSAVAPNDPPEEAASDERGPDEDAGKSPTAD